MAVGNILQFMILLLPCVIDISDAQDSEKPSIYYLHIESDIKYRFATTLVTSKVVNPSREAKEARFDVTLPDEAYISDFVMEIGGRVYPGEINEKQKAKKKYDTAKQRGQSAGIVSQRPRETNRFSVEVNVGAQEKVTFNLTYQELLHRSKGSYDHVIYINPGQVVDDFRISISIEESRDITNIYVPPLRNDLTTSVNGSNELAIIERPSSRAAIVHFNPSKQDQEKRSKEGINGLFVVEYDIDRKTDAGDILVVNGYFVHFFAPKDMEPIPKDVLFILDVSTSMTGTKIAQLRDAMVKILGDLHEGDRFNIMQFSSNLKYWRPDKVVTATKANIERAQNYIKRMRPNGWTNINAAITEGVDFLKDLKDTNGRSPVLLFLTDGEPTDGVQDIDKILQNVREKNTVELPVFSLAFGRGADYEFVKKVALQNNGVSRKIYEDSDATLQIKGFYDDISAATLKNVEFKYLDGKSGVENLTQANFNSFFSGSEIVVAGQIDNSIQIFDLSVKGQGAKGTIELALSSDIDDKPFAGVSELTKPEDYQKITENIWAFLTIKQLLENSIGETDPVKKAEYQKRALDLSLKYKFVTPLTSMVVTKPDERDVADLKEGEDADLTRASAQVAGKAISDNAGGGGGGGGRGGGGSYGGGGGGDPHFMIRMKGLEHPVCFDIDGKSDDVMRLLTDPGTGLTINAGIVASSMLNRHGHLKSFIGELRIFFGDLTISIKPTKILVNGAEISWDDERPFFMDGVKLNVVAVKNETQRLLKIDFGNDVHIVIGQHLRKTRDSISYLNMYIDKETGLSRRTDGILGQFVHKKVELRKEKVNMKGKIIGVLRIKERGHQTNKRTVLTYRKDKITSIPELCWTVHHRVNGLFKEELQKYFLKDIQNH